MKRTIYSIALFSIGILSACGNSQQSATAKKDFTPDEVKVETKKANDFFDLVFDAAVDRDPVRQTRLGIKKDYGKWTDISDEHAQKELEITKANLDSLHKNINPDALDAQAKISFRLFEKDCNQKIDNFKWRFHDYPVTQMQGMHTEIPSFLINMHNVSNRNDAEAYISRLSGINALFDQLIANLKIREEKNIIPPKFVFPYE